jgi:hypothetical protein
MQPRIGCRSRLYRCFTAQRCGLSPRAGTSAAPARCCGSPASWKPRRPPRRRSHHQPLKRSPAAVDMGSRAGVRLTGNLPPPEGQAGKRSRSSSSRSPGSPSTEARRDWRPRRAGLLAGSGDGSPTEVDRACVTFRPLDAEGSFARHYGARVGCESDRASEKGALAMAATESDPIALQTFELLPDEPVPSEVLGQNLRCKSVLFAYAVGACASS